MMLIGFLYNLFLFFGTKEKIYFLYVVFIFFNTICYTFNNNFSMIGDAPWLWTKHISWQFLGDLSTTVFIIYFLKIKQNAPLLFKIYMFLISIDFIIAFLNLIGFPVVKLIDYYELISLILVIYTLFMAVYFVVKRVRNAIFFLVSWTFLLITIIFFIMKINGILPYNEVLRYSVYLGITAEVSLFSLALADRLNLLQNEKKKLLMQNLKLIQEQNKVLEKKVLEKTAKLRVQNKIKDSLIQEVNHRVKNNLQTILSLIYMQEKSLKPNETKGLQETQLRIKAMSLVHEMLYSNKNFDAISIKDYLSSLVVRINSMINNKSKSIYLDVVSEDVKLDLNTCITLGMFTNEAITNSIKYAFDSVLDAKITLTLSQNEKNIFFCYSRQWYWF